MNNPHDKFCKEILTRRENAVSFFREYLPEDLSARADWRTLKIVKATFISPTSQQLKERFSDILYTVRVKGATVFIYLLFERRPTPDDLMPLRLFYYMGEAWELFLNQNPEETRLPGIVPILFYHGESPWSVSPQFQDMIAEPELTADYSPRFRHVLMDFSRFGDAEIKGNVFVRLFLSVARRIYAPDFNDHFDKMLPLFAELSRKRTGMQYLETVLRYLYAVRDDMDPEETEKKLVSAIDEDKKEGIVTVAEKLRNEGRVEGEIQGKIEGKIEGEIQGEIKTYKELLAKGLLPKDMAAQKLEELNRKLEELSEKDVDFTGQ